MAMDFYMNEATYLLKIIPHNQDLTNEFLQRVEIKKLRLLVRRRHGCPG